MTTMWPNGTVAVAVPATSANVGPGFDFLGVALELRDRYRAAAFGHGTDRTAVKVTWSGDGPEGPIPTDETNLVAASLMTGLSRWCPESPESITLHCYNDIPHGRGLGSSSAAIVGGLGLARALCPPDLAPSLEDMLVVAAEIEGHPDNVAPALLGGFTPTWTQSDGAKALWLQPHPRISPVLAIPTSSLSTAAARAVMPVDVPLSDAVFNASRATVLGYAMTMAPELLFEATDDRLHQQCRGAVYPQSVQLVAALRAQGLAAVISGAGPSVMVLAVDDVAAAAQAVAEATDGQWRILTPGFATRGLVDVDPADVL
jgi:homoserine kinase